MHTVLLSSVVVLEGIILLSLWAVFYQLLQQRGRLLVRLDVMESRLSFLNQLVAKGEQPDRPQPPQIPTPQTVGLSAGSPFSPFELPDLEGNVTRLESFSGKRLLVVHWNPGCGFCSLIAPDLAEMQDELARNNVHVLFLSHGEVEPNQKLISEHGLNVPVLLLNETPLPAFQNQGTPVAYLVDEHGIVAHSLAVGANDVPTLARTALSSWPVGSEATLLRHPANGHGSGSSHFKRVGIQDGLPPGTLAPAFTLPDLLGNTISLADYRGKQVLLVFSDPNCGPCNLFAPELARLYLERPNTPVIYVGRGDLEENRKKAQEHGFEFPVVVQKQWELSKQYGIFATPVAFLIDENGTVAKPVAQGGSEIFALYSEAESRAFSMM